MTLDNIRSSNPRKKAIAGIVLLVIFLLVWQISSLFGKAAGSSPNGSAANKSVAVAQTPAATPAPPPPPKQATVVQTTPMTDRETALVTLQQETQIKYLQAVNELQLLKVSRDIAQANKDISSANLDKVTNDKKVIDLLSTPLATTTTTTITTSQEGGAPAATTATAAGPAPVVAAPLGETAYTVVSISQVQYRWGAVLSNRGTLYNVHVGDILSDGSTVVAITKDSVTLQKEGVRKKISLVSII